ncbi:hypothetical protein GCM10009737_06390 [Nocardioides lentus]|uniref:Amidase domain-containing protein n=1 Tax=Nocardioides lentus TaxID=338077 RepID=A0ABN2NZL0_9ACTN
MSARTPSGPTRDRRRRVAAAVAAVVGATALTTTQAAPSAAAPAAASDAAPEVTGGGYLAPYFTEGDLTDDEAVSLDDLDLVGPALGTTDTDAGWSGLAPADLDADGELELRDLADLAQRVLYDDGPFELVEATALDMQRAMNAGTVTSVELTRAYLDRIAAYDGLADEAHARALNSVLTTGGEAALAAAAESDALRARDGGPRSMVDGIPVLVKDNFDTVDMPTSAGHGSWETNQTATDASMVEGLREGGAVLLGKASMDEWALGFSSAYTTGVAAGSSEPVASPYALTRTAGGSSGGTGASIASNLGAIGFGTDTGGSIRVPASYNQLVGVRPTVGLASRDGIVPLALSQDTGGPITRSVSDAAIALDEVVGVDPADPVTAEQDGRVPDSYTRFLDDDALEGARIGYVPSMVGTNATTVRLFEAAVADLTAQGATVVPVDTTVLGPTLAEPSGSTNEFKHDLQEYVAAHLDPDVTTRTLADIIASGRLVPGREGTYRTRDAVTPEQYDAWITSHSAAIATGEQVTTGLLDDNDLDALVYPSGNPYGTQGTNLRLGPNTGMPSVTVPMGQASATEAIPGAGVNLEFLGRNYSEGDLLGLTYDYEQATGHRTTPALYPALDDAPARAAGGTAGGARSAADPEVSGVSVSVSDDALQVGDEVTVTVAADSVADLYAYDLDLGVDPEVLSLVDGSVDADEGGATYARAGESGVEVAHTRLGSSPALTGEAVLATLTFEAVGAGATEVEALSLAQVGSDLAEATGTALGSAAVTVDLADAPVATATPRVIGTVEPGRTVRTDGAAWDLADVEETYQWLLDGEPVDGATSSTYRVSAREAGARLAVRVTGTVPGSAPGTATSTGRAVRALTTRTTVSTTPTVRMGRRPVATIRVAADALTPRGAVLVRYAGRVVRQGLRLDERGVARFRLPARARTGRVPVAAVYDPATGFAASRGRTTIRVTR